MVSFSNSGFRPPELQRNGQSLIFTIRARRHPAIIVFAAVWFVACTGILITMLTSRLAFVAFIPLLMLVVFALIFVPMLLGREIIELNPSVVRFYFAAGPYNGNANCLRLGCTKCAKWLVPDPRGTRHLITGRRDTCPRRR